MEKEDSLGELKKDYLEIQKKFDLPSFEELNKEFQIEKIAEIETDFLIREVRKFVADKFSNYFRFIETLLQPVNAPMFVFSIIKTLGTEEKDKLTEIYKELAKIEVQLIELDLDFNEEKEVKFIKDFYVFWQGIKKEMKEIFEVVKKNWDNKVESNNKGYFG